MFLGQVPGPPVVLVVGHAVVELTSRKPLISKVNVVVVQGAPLRAPFVVQEHAVKADPVALRVNVQLAHGIGLVAGIAERLCHCRDIGHRQLIVEHPVAMRPGAHPRHQGAAGRNADRAFRIGVCVPHACCGKLVQARGYDRWITGKTEMLGSPVIGHDQQDVRPWIRH